MTILKDVIVPLRVVRKKTALFMALHAHEAAQEPE
jgi:hypothetical protein